MIFQFIIRNYRIILDVLLVAGAVVAFSFWDPFNFFSVRARVIDTPVSVKSIRQIAEFTSAEYYGEVVASINEKASDTLAAAEIKEEFEHLYGEIKEAIDEVKENREAYKKDYGGSSLFGIYKRAFRQLRNQEHYDYTYKVIHKNERKAIMAIASDTSTTLSAWLSGSGSPQKGRDHEAYVNELVAKNKNKKELVYIGRGWVKAGFDFKHFSENQFTYYEDRKFIVIRGLKPKILDADINPWFIPEKALKGFELFKYKGKLKFQDVARVKKLCKIKLIQDAHDREILEKATKNAANFFQRFFSEIYDTPIDSVIIGLPHYTEMEQRIMADTLLNDPEINELKQEMNDIYEGKQHPAFETLGEQRMAFAGMMKSLNGFVLKTSQMQDTARWGELYRMHRQKQTDKEKELTGYNPEMDHLLPDKKNNDG